MLKGDAISAIPTILNKKSRQKYIFGGFFYIYAAYFSVCLEPRNASQLVPVRYFTAMHAKHFSALK